MTQPNWFEKICGIRQWYFLIALWNCIRTAAACPSGTFKSDFLSGGCALCPQKLKYCENEQLVDSARCLKACRGRGIWPILSTTPQDPTHAVRKSSTSPHRTTTEAPEIITKAIPTKRVLIKISTVFKDVRIFKTPSDSTSEPSDHRNRTDIIFGIAVSVLALLLVLVVFLVVCWRGRSNSRSNHDKRAGARISYNPVHPGSRSSSDHGINSATVNLENTDEVVDEENIGNSLTTLSISREDFDNMPEVRL